MTALKSLCVENFVAFQQPLKWTQHASLNVIIGENDTGKTHLLKLLYAMSRSIEDHSKKQAGPEPKELSELLAQKLRWTFLPQKLELGRLVTRGSGNRLSVELCWNAGGHLKFRFGKDTVECIRIRPIVPPAPRGEFSIDDALAEIGAADTPTKLSECKAWLNETARPPAKYKPQIKAALDDRAAKNDVEAQQRATRTEDREPGADDE